MCARWASRRTAGGCSSAPRTPAANLPSRSIFPARITCATRLPRSQSASSSACRRQPSPGRLRGAGSFTLIDDYGHHPAEMAATLAAARGAFPGRRILLAFQPHRYTRTRDCFEDFVQVLSTAGALVLTEVYPAGEAPIVAAAGKALARAIRVQARVEPVFVEKIAELPAAILGLARDGDVV